MNTNFNELKTAFANLVETFEQSATDAIAEANANKEQLLALYKAMNQNAYALSVISEISETVGSQLFDLSERCENVVANINHSLSEGCYGIPEGDYETFIGFCGKCGKEIHKNDTYGYEGGDEYVCANCLMTDRPDMPVEEKAESLDENDEAAPATNNE